MKKTLIAAALCSMAAGAMAANVTLYGVVDEAAYYTNTKQAGVSDSKLVMQSGLNGASRWGIKGSEDLGNGYSVGFILEDGIAADTGVEGGNFDRYSVLQVGTPYGAFQFGRMGVVTGGTSGGVMTANMGATGTSFKAAGTEALMVCENARFDNGIEYKTPSMAGFQITLQYSLGVGTEGGNAHNSDTFFAAAVEYKNGPFAAGVGYDRLKPAYRQDELNTNCPQTVLGYANYDFGVAKVYFGGQYNQHKSVAPGVTYSGLGAAAKGTAGRSDWNSYVVTVGAGIPLAGGQLMPNFGYFKAEDKAFAAADIKGFNFGLTYTYNLSKRTCVYGTAAYLQAKQDGTKNRLTSAGLGLKHTF